MSVGSLDVVRPPSIVLFDLGGVLMDFAGLGRLASITGLANDADLRDRWAYDNWQHTLEIGHCSSEEFAAGIVTDWDLPLSPAEFLAEFASWPAGPFVGAIELIRSLHGKIRMGCLSNTNSVHWQRHLDHWGIVDYFDCTFVSHELGLSKPDPAIYHHVLDELGIDALAAGNDVLFLDDREDNVLAACEVGIRAERTRGIDEVKASIRRNLPDLDI